ncbi:MAG: PaaX family transcriptional regulator, partial [Thermocrispum sp.]
QDGAGRFDPAPQQLVMTLLGAYVQPRETRTVWAGGLVRLLADLGFSAGAARVALTRLGRRDLLSRRKRGRRVHYTLTGRARVLLAEGDRRIFTLGEPSPAEPEWTLLWHAIPDARRRARDELVRRLRFLGFGPIQDGTWVAARQAEPEVRALLEELGIGEFAGLMLTRPARPADARAFVARAWDLAALDSAYAAFVTEFGEPPEDGDRAAFVQRSRLVHAFRQFPRHDPGLPAELADPPARRADAVLLFHDSYTALEPAAQRYFDEVTTPAGGSARPSEGRTESRVAEGATMGRQYPWGAETSGLKGEQ